MAFLHWLLIVKPNLCLYLYNSLLQLTYVCIKKGDVCVIKMKLFSKKKENDSLTVLQTASRENFHPFLDIGRYIPLMDGEYQLYSALREAVPIIDAALDKIVRLVGDFSIQCKNQRVSDELNYFLKNVRLGGGNYGIDSFFTVYLNQLLTYGTAVGEIVLSGNGKEIYSLVNAPLKNIDLTYDDNLIDVLVCTSGFDKDKKILPYQNLLFVSTLNPEPGKLKGTSLLKGLPFVSGILLKIFNTIGVNWERVGNVRFAVTYKPSSDGDRAMSRQRAVQIADVSVKVIGADNQILDSNVPVRQILEQIVAKLSIPPFLLGLSWSTTERMSSQQADILTSELEYYRRILNGVITKICDVWLQIHGVSQKYEIVWNNINLQDEVELAHARLYNSQANKIEKELNELNEQKSN